MHVSSLPLALAGLVLIGAGCGPTANVDQRLDGTVNYTDPETGAQVNVGTGASIPADFPAEVPRYENGTVITAAVGSEIGGDPGSQGATLMFTSEDSTETVSAWYDAELTGDGWKKSGSYSASGGITNLYAKAGTTIGVTVTVGTDGDPTTAMVIWAPSGS